MFEAKSWDGTKRQFYDYEHAVSWTKDHLSHWMAEDDFISNWPASGGRFFCVMDESCEHTDASVLILEILEGSVNGGCFKCQHALDLSTSRHDTRRKTFGVYLDWLWIADCVSDNCDAVTMIMASRDVMRWPHRAYKSCEVHGCIHKSIYRICMECMKDLSGKMRGDVAVSRPGAVERALNLIPRKYFITKED